MHWLTEHAICVQEVEKLLSGLGASSWDSSFTSGMLGGGEEGLCFSYKALYSLYIR